MGFARFGASTPRTCPGRGRRRTILIDPLISAETAAPRLGLLGSHRAERTVIAVTYTHAPVDLFGGVRIEPEGDLSVLGSDRPHGFSFF
jgi:hypothetical protein